MKYLSIAADDPGRFLSSVLQAVEAQISVTCRLVVGGYPEDPTFVMELVAFEQWSYPWK